MDPYAKRAKPAGFAGLLFHGKGRKGKRHVAAVGLSPSRSDSKSAQHKKSSSAATWIFCMEPNSFGVTRGEQPLVRASRASKVAETLPR